MSQLQKKEYVRSMFAGISRRYDLLNHLLSLEKDKQWRRFAVSKLPPGHIIDICSGTGDVAIEAAKKKKTEQEDALLVVLEKAEEIKKELTAKEQKAKEEEKKFSVEESRIKADFTKVENELNKLLKDRDEHCARIGKDLLKRYTQLFESKNGLVVAAVKNGNCLGCHMNIPPQTLTEVRKNSKIIQCFNCSRILYWKDAS